MSTSSKKTVKIWQLVCGEGDEAPAGDAGAGGVADSTPNVQFTPEQQAHINKIAAKERREAEERANKQLEAIKKELDTAREKSNMTAQERADMEERLKQVMGENKTTEQKFQEQISAAEKAYKKEQEKLAGDRDRFKQLFETHLFEAAVGKATIDNKGCDSEAFEAMLRPNYVLHDVLDADGKPTGKLVPRIRQVTEKDGKQEVAFVSIDDAIKAMANNEKYYYLFDPSGRGGIGGSNQPGRRQGKIDLTNMKEYMARRSELGLPPVSGEKKS